ncbi:MAG: hypothetical protein AAB303_06975, partial [Chloroflexota bacterium]
KRWRVVEVLARGEVPEVKPIEIGSALEDMIQATAEKATPLVSEAAEAMVEPEPETEKEVTGS